MFCTISLQKERVLVIKSNTHTHTNTLTLHKYTYTILYTILYRIVMNYTILFVSGKWSAYYTQGTRNFFSEIPDPKNEKKNEIIPKYVKYTNNSYIHISE